LDTTAGNAAAWPLGCAQLARRGGNTDLPIRKYNRLTRVWLVQAKLGQAPMQTTFAVICATVQTKTLSGQLNQGMAQFPSETVSHVGVAVFWTVGHRHVKIHFRSLGWRRFQRHQQNAVTTFRSGKAPLRPAGEGCDERKKAAPLDAAEADVGAAA
jgi:hypothetical protein